MSMSCRLSSLPIIVFYERDTLGMMMMIYPQDLWGIEGSSQKDGILITDSSSVSVAGVIFCSFPLVYWEGIFRNLFSVILVSTP